MAAVPVLSEVDGQAYLHREIEILNERHATDSRELDRLGQQLEEAVYSRAELEAKVAELESAAQACAEQRLNDEIAQIREETKRDLENLRHNAAESHQVDDRSMTCSPQSRSSQPMCSCGELPLQYLGGSAGTPGFACQCNGRCRASPTRAAIRGPSP